MIRNNQGTYATDAALSPADYTRRSISAPLASASACQPCCINVVASSWVTIDTSRPNE
jgi:hypothetical protein